MEQRLNIDQLSIILDFGPFFETKWIRMFSFQQYKFEST